MIYEIGKIVNFDVIFYKKGFSFIKVLVFNKIKYLKVFILFCID